MTEKATMLGALQNRSNNPSIKKCQSPKVVFVVDPRANKREIAKAVEEIYEKNKIKVVSVNTLHVKAKQRRVRGRQGWRAEWKKAIVTLEPGDAI